MWCWAIRVYILAGVLLATVAIAATPPLYAGRFHTMIVNGVLPCASMYVVREQVGWILQLSWNAVAFIAGGLFATVSLHPRFFPIVFGRSVKPAAYFRRLEARHEREGETV